MGFSLDRCWLACASDRGTVHVFKVEEEEDPSDSHSHSTFTSMSINTNGETKSNTITTPITTNTKTKKKSSYSSTTSYLAKKLLPKALLTSPRKHLLEGENSFVQVRGVTHPKACAFVPDKPHTIAVAGLDDFWQWVFVIS